MMKTDFLLIGGGVAGLSAANHLADQGANVTLIEAGSYPAHKICGEFISPEALPILERWDIVPPCTITTAEIITPKRRCTIALPRHAATLPRFILDEALAKRAENRGACIQTGVRVENIEIPTREGSPFLVTLESGEQWSAPNLLLSTGRIKKVLPEQKEMQKFCYIGAKAHFEGVSIPEKLLMHLVPGAYFGIAPIGENRVNVAGIIACTQEEAKNPRATLSSFLERADAIEIKKTLSSSHCLFKDWMVGPVPEFGIRDRALWPNTFLLGDAAGVIPPATGNGLAMGITSGILAAEYALKKDLAGYFSCWNREYRQRIIRGKLLHRLFLSPWLNGMIPQIGKQFPGLVHQVFQCTRGK